MSNMSNSKYNQAVGRRKEASARVRLTTGKGEITINERPLAQYFTLKIWQDLVKSPLEVVSKENDLDVSVKVSGGGVQGQAEAVRHGIARALVMLDEGYKPALKAHGLMTRDARVKERKKAGLRKARRGRQWRKR